MASVILIMHEYGSAFRLVGQNTSMANSPAALQAAPLNKDGSISDQEWHEVAWDCIDRGEVARCEAILERLRVLEKVARMSWAV